VRVLIVVLVRGENKVNSYSDQLKLGQACKFGVEFDKIITAEIVATNVVASQSPNGDRLVFTL